MMFCLVLHTTHEHQPTEAFSLVVAARGNLMVHEGTFIQSAFNSSFSLVVADEDIS
jgi:hypothetical protein